jgi:PAS domain S-box-containing protein
MTRDAGQLADTASRGEEGTSSASSTQLESHEPPVREASTTGPTPKPAERQDLFRLLVESVRDYAIFMLDPAGYVTTWNSGAAHIKGYTREEIVGKHFSVFYPPEAIARRLPQFELEVASEHGRFEDEGWRLRKDGSAFWASVILTAMRDERGELRGFAKVTRDLTARRKFEDLQRTERQMNEFLAMLAHELRNPLAPIQSALEVVERNADDPATWRWARDIIARQAHQLKRLVDDLLDVSRITRGKIDLHPEAVDLRTIISQVGDSWRTAIEGRRQTLVTSVPKERVDIYVDPMRLAQTLSNLVGNATKYTHDGGRIELRVRVNGGVASTTVADNGIGMSAEIIPRVFELFVQGERGLDRREGGLGVGLTVAKRLTDLLGGTLTATSAGPGQGSEFMLGLPTTMEPEPPVAPLPPHGASTPRRARTILVVDDNEDAADALAALLEILGHQAIVLNDGVDVIRVATARRPDVIFLDIGLPGMDGMQIARSLRVVPELHGTRVIAYTGYGREEDARRIAEAGFDGHLVKPVTAADLERVIDG